jgi:nucleoside-diphosphate-sugar epimerase
MAATTIPDSPRLLVVGGSGFIGNHIVNRATSLGWKVTSLSLRSQPGVLRAGVSNVAADAASGVALKQTLGGAAFEYVVNCAGYIDHLPFFQGGRRHLDGHLGIALNLAETLDRGVLQAFVNLGSSDEYGGNPAPQVETQREAPISPYATGKVAATHFLQMLHRTDGFPATSLRLFLTYGPGQDDKRLLPQIIIGCLAGRAFATSAGEQLRDFCFIQDTVRAVFAALTRPEAQGEVINIASGRPVAIRHVIESVRSKIGDGKPQYGEIPYRPGENMKLYADVSKAQALLGWSPEVSLDHGLDETIDWFRGNS